MCVFMCSFFICVREWECVFMEEEGALSGVKVFFREKKERKKEVYP